MKLRAPHLNRESHPWATVRPGGLLLRESTLDDCARCVNHLLRCPSSDACMIVVDGPCRGMMVRWSPGTTSAPIGSGVLVWEI